MFNSLFNKYIFSKEHSIEWIQHKQNVLNTKKKLTLKFERQQLIMDFYMDKQVENSKT